MGTTDINSYISLQEADIQHKLQILRNAIIEIAPKATEKISYTMPTFYLNGNLVHFAAYKNHIGFYPAPSGITHFIDELKDFKTSKGAIQFPNDKPLPIELIQKIVAFRVNENLNKSR
jgi:uncharacterized protein YdhG (YjbR/CyaY superfamily)